MIQFNKQIYDDVQKLKRMQKLKDRTKYADFKRELCAKYKVVPRTIELWMNKRMPGQRKGRNDAGRERVKVKPSVKRKIAEMVESGVNIKEVKKLTGVSKEKINKQREKMQSDTDSQELKESSFGGKAKELFEKLFQMDLIAPERGIKISTKKDGGKREYIIIPKSDVEDICLILGNAYNRAEFAEKNKYPVDRQALREKMILHLIEMQIRLATMNSNTKDIEALTRMHDRMKESFEMNADIKVVEKICKELKPDIGFDDIVGLIKKHSEG